MNDDQPTSTRAQHDHTGRSPGNSHVTIPALLKQKRRGEKVVMVTCYDFPSARLLDEAGIDVLLVGDSLGDNVLGYPNTLPVTLDDMIHHAAAVRRGTKRALIVVDMPFLSFQVSPEDALRSAGRILKETGAEAVKLEGGAVVAPTVRKLTGAGVPVMGHVGLTPQSIHALGGYRTQGREPEAADRLLADTQALVEAGAFAIVLELVPADLARRVTAEIPVPTIGIGAGPECDGQVLVFHDVFGYTIGRTFRHVTRYAEVGQTILSAAERFAADVRSGAFPAQNQSY